MAVVNFLQQTHFKILLCSPFSKGMGGVIKMLTEIEEFESMRDMAELRALSATSLLRPLNGTEHKRMMELSGVVL